MADPVTQMAIATALSVGGMLVQSSAARTAGESEAAQLEKAAEDVKALGTRQAYEAKREGEYVKSAARTAMVGGGGTTTDPGAIKTLAEIQTQADYNALSAIYESESKSKKLMEAARARRAGASSQSLAGIISASATALGGASEIYDYYNPRTR